MREPAAVPVFELRGVTLRYPGAAEPALDGLTTSVGPGSFTAVIGPNGAGKSTLVRLLTGLLAPTSGAVSLEGRPLDAWARRARARRIAVVSQEAAPSGLPLAVREYVELGRNPHASPWTPLGPGDREVVDEALAHADLMRLAARSLSTLSGGERQRAKLARALAQEPAILILDEPTAHLDFAHALWIFEELRRLRASRGMTVICVTHDINLASRYAQHLLLLSRGCLLASGSPERVLVNDVVGAAFECEVHIEDLGPLGRSVLPLGPGDGAS